VTSKSWTFSDGDIELPRIVMAPITIFGSSISSSENVQDLGVTIEPSLSMKTHLSKLCNYKYKYT